MHNRTIGTNGSIVEWTWKVDFIDPLASEIHIQGHGSFYLFTYEYFRNQCIHIIRDTVSKKNVAMMLQCG